MIEFRKNACALVLTAAACLAVLPAPAQEQIETGGRARQQYDFAHGLLQREFFDLAEQEFRDFLETYPEHELAPRAALSLVRCLRAQKSIDGALQVIGLMTRQWPDNELTARAVLIQGDILFARERYDQAADAFRSLTGHDNTRIRETALYFLAESYVRTDRTDDALPLFQRLAAETFDQTHVYRPYAAFVLASAHEKQGHADQADAFYRRLSEDRQGIPPHLREEALYRRGEIAFLHDRYEAAIEFYEHLLRDFPEGRFAREAAKRRVWAHLSLGLHEAAARLAVAWRQAYGDIHDPEFDYVHASAMLALDRFTAAETLFARVAAAHETGETQRRLAAYQRVYCLLRTERFEDALRVGEDFLARYPGAPETADVAYFAGTAACRLDRCQHAVPLLQRALDAYVGDWQHLHNARLALARALHETGQAAQAAQLYLDVAETETGERRTEFLLEAADLLETSDRAEAAATYRQAIAQTDDPKLLQTAAIRLARIQLTQRDYQAAADTLMELLDDDAQLENPAAVQLLVGFAFLQQGELERAESMLREALQNSRSREMTAGIQYYLVAVLFRQERTDEALAQFAAVLDYPPELRPDLDPELLLELETVYFNRHNYELSARIARILADSSDPAVAFLAGQRLSRTMMATARLEDARDLLEQLRQTAASMSDDQLAALEAPEAQILSRLGEVYLSMGQADRAVRMFDQALTADALPMTDMTRAHWGLAAVFLEEERLERALRHAIAAFVTGNDPVYTPRSMLIAIRVLVAQNKLREAAQTWQELRTRFPAYAEKQKQLDVIEQLRDEQLQRP